MTNCNGGGIHGSFNSGVISLIRSTLSQNTALRGGGFSHESEAELKIIDCIFDNNTATAIDDIAGEGGGLYLTRTAAGVIEGSSFIANTAQNDGGGIYRSAFSSSSTPFLITNCTFTANTANDEGGALFLTSSHATDIRHSTLIGNISLGVEPLPEEEDDDRPTFSASNSLPLWTRYAGRDRILFPGREPTTSLRDALLSRYRTLLTAGSSLRGGGGIRSVGGPVTLGNSIVAGNFSPSAPDALGSFTFNGRNFIGDPSSATGFREGTDLSFTSTNTVLSDLVDATVDSENPALIIPNVELRAGQATIPLTLGSPAINAGETSAIPADHTDADNDDNTNERLPLDALNAPRVVSFTPDLGAVEFCSEITYVAQSSDLQITSDPDNNGLTRGDTVTWKPGQPDSITGLVFGTNAFTSAVDALENTCVNGTINIAEGRYEEGRPIDINRNITVIGDSNGPTILSGSRDPEFDDNRLAHQVMTILGEFTTVTLDSLSIVNGYSDSNTGAYGAGLSILPNTWVNLRNSTLSGHLCDGENQTAFSSSAAIGNQGNLLMENSTLYGNRVRGGRSSNAAGAFGNFGRAELNHCTITANTAEGNLGFIGGLFNDQNNGANITLRNSIVTGNSGQISENIFGYTNVATDNNLIDIPANTIFVTDFADQPILADNGGPTQTVVLIPGSPAIDAARSTAFTTDQRGLDFARFLGDAPDIGAYEFTSFDPFSDPDGDGLSIILERSLGTDIAQSSFGSPQMPKVAPGNNGSITYTFGRGPNPLPNTRVIVERSTTLAANSFTEIFSFDFDSATTTPIVNGITSTVEMDQFIIRDENTLPGKAFYRLKIDR